MKKETNAAGRDSSEGSSFQEVLKGEWNQLEKRRKVAFRIPGDEFGKAAKAEDHQAMKPESPSGLSFSGGGLRSASFCMGITQAFHKTGLWRFFDYLSTVSGGGYLGSYISSAAIKNKKRIAKEGGKFPLPAEEKAGKGQPAGQSDEVKKFIYGGRYLMRGWQLANKYLIGLILSNLTLFSALVAACALIAFLWRCFDFPGFRETVRPIAHATELNFLPSDVMAAFYPFVFFAIAWLVAWSLSYLRRGSEATGRVARVLLFWVVASLLIGCALVLSNGDAQGFIQGFDPSALGAKFWGPVVAIVGGSLIPFLRPSRLMQSGLNPKNQFEKITFTVATTGLLVGLPLLLIGLLGKENVSGYYTSKDREVVPGDLGASWKTITATILSPEFVTLSVPGDSKSNQFADRWSLEKRRNIINSPDGIRPHLTKELQKDFQKYETEVYEQTLKDVSAPIRKGLAPFLQASGTEFNKLAEQLDDIIGNHDIEIGSSIAELEELDKEKLRRLFLSDPEGNPTGDSEESRLMAKHYLLWLCIHMRYQERKSAEATRLLQGKREWTRTINRDRLKRSADALEWLAGFRRSLENPAEMHWYWGNQKALTQRIICDSLNEFFKEPQEGTDSFPHFAGSFSETVINESEVWNNIFPPIETGAGEAPPATDSKSKLFKHVGENFPSRIKEDYNRGVTIGSGYATPLVLGLNTVIRNGPIYTEERFDGIKLRPQTEALLLENPKGNKLVHLNRLLLEDAFLYAAENSPIPGEYAPIQKTSPNLAFPQYLKRNDPSLKKKLLEEGKTKEAEAFPPPALRSIVIYEDQAARLKIFVVALGVFALGLLVDLNFTSMHGYYRRRIASAFIVPEGEKRESPMLSALNTTEYGYPYHLMSATVHQPQSRLSDEIREATSAAVREDNSEVPIVAPFLFSQLYCGSEAAGYMGTERYEELPVGDLSNIDLADAAAISGAAMSPGRVQNLLLSFLMFILNLRLGQWLPNPAKGRPPGRPRLGLFLKNAFRQTNDRDYLFLSDGGHVENLGLVQLLHRRCRLVVAIDAGRDPGHDFSDLARAIRIARIEEGIDIIPLEVSGQPRTEDIVSDLEFEKKRIKGTPTPECAKHFSMARIVYPEAGARDGLLIYVKPSLTGDEGIDLIQYSRANADFPHQSTSDQEFEWDQVESYRQLGFHIGSSLAELLPPVCKGPGDLWEESAETGDPIERVCKWFEDSWKNGSVTTEPVQDLESVKRAVVDEVSQKSSPSSPPAKLEDPKPRSVTPKKAVKSKGGSKSKKAKKSGGKVKM